MPVLDSNVWVTETERKSFERAIKLSQAGWFNQAQLEMGEILAPMNNDAKVVFAKYFAKLYNYPLVIKLLTDASNGNPEYKNPALVELGFPFPYKYHVQSFAKKNGLDPLLVISLIRQESAFALKAQSTSQAQGLMQIIGPTANEIAADLKVKSFKSSDIFDPKTNIEFGSYYLAKVIRQFNGNVSLGLAAYNAGPTRLKKYLEARPEIMDYGKLSQENSWSDLWIEELPWMETNLYVKSILRNYLIYQLLEKSEIEVSLPVWKSAKIDYFLHGEK